MARIYVALILLALSGRAVAQSFPKIVWGSRNISASCPTLRLHPSLLTVSADCVVSPGATVFVGANAGCIGDSGGGFGNDLCATPDLSGRTIDCTSCTGMTLKSGTIVPAGGTVCWTGSTSGTSCVAAPAAAGGTNTLQPFTVNLVGTLVAATADSSAIASTTTETGFSNGTYSFAANSLTAGKVIRVKAWGRFSTTGTPTMQWNLRWGAVNTDPIIVGTSVITDPISGASNEQWQADAMVTVRTTGSSGTVDGTGAIKVPTTSGRIDTLEYPDVVSGTTTINTTATTVMTLMFDWGTNSASNTILLSGWVVEAVN